MKDIFDELAVLVPDKWQVTYWRLVNRLRRLDPNDEVLLIVWALGLFTLVIARECRNLAWVLTGMKAVRADLEKTITKAGLGIYYRGKAGLITSAPSDYPELLIKWMRIIFALVLVLVVEFFVLLFAIERLIASPAFR